MAPDQSAAAAPDEKLDGVSEHTEITMVVLGLFMELTTQFGILAGDMRVSDWIVFPLCLAALPLWASRCSS